MDHLDFSPNDAMLEFPGGFGASNDPRANTYPPFLQQPNTQHFAWRPLTYETMGGDGMSTHHHGHHYHQQGQQDQYHHHQSQTYPFPSSSQQQQQQQQTHQLPQQHHSRPSSHHANQPMTLQTAALDQDYNLLPINWQHQFRPAVPQQQYQDGGNTLDMNAFNTAAFGGAQLQASPVDFMAAANPANYAVSSAMDSTNYIPMGGPMDSMGALVYPLTDFPHDSTPFGMALHQATQHADSSHASIPSGSPTGTNLEVQSLPDEWSMVNYNTNRNSYESNFTVSNPSQALHIRTNSDSSDSDGPSSADLSGSFEEIPPWPLSSPHDFHGSDFLDAQYIQHAHGLPMHSHHHVPPPSLAVSPSAGVSKSYHSSASSSTSPTSSGPTSPPLRRRKSPSDAKTTKAVIKKTSPSSTARKDAPAEKKVGRRRGPLRPDQRQQAHEIRKLRACLRCKFLKKTCDKGEPCGGCRPSHARLWQVPCTRVDIKDISYFMKDWKADYERHVSLGFSVGNIKGFSTMERTLYITHGYGHYLPITAREVFVRDNKCFEVDWVEGDEPGNPKSFEVNTAKLSAGMEGVSTTLLSEYLDRHLDSGFEEFVDNYFAGTKFVSEIMKTAYRYYQKEKTPCVRKALKLVLAYNLTLHITTVEGLSEEEAFDGKIDQADSKFRGKTVAPVMINFQVKCALADMWRELQKDVLEELSALYSSVYSGDKLKNWPTIFMLAAILLAIWEEMQFDCHYRIPDEKAVNKFCDDMETTPVGVIVGLFQAISTKLPGLQEWDTRKHHHLLGSNPAVCEALTEVRGHVNKYETYLKERAAAKFDRDDFDSLSNKFLSKLVIRAN